MASAFFIVATYMLPTSFCRIRNLRRPPVPFTDHPSCGRRPPLRQRSRVVVPVYVRPGSPTTPAHLQSYISLLSIAEGIKGDDETESRRRYLLTRRLGGGVMIIRAKLSDQKASTYHCRVRARRWRSRRNPETKNLGHLRRHPRKRSRS